MEANKDLENVTEGQTATAPATNNGEKKGLFLSGIIVGFAATLLIVGGAATGGYAWYDYNTRNHITSMEKSEREDLNRTVAGQLPEGLEENQILVTSKLTKTAFRSEETVTFYIYSVAEGANADELWGLKNSEAKKDESLTCVASGTAVLDRDTMSLTSAQVKPEE